MIDERTLQRLPHEDRERIRDLEAVAAMARVELRVVAHNDAPASFVVLRFGEPFPCATVDAVATQLQNFGVPLLTREQLRQRAAILRSSLEMAYRGELPDDEAASREVH